MRRSTELAEAAQRHRQRLLRAWRRRAPLPDLDTSLRAQVAANSHDCATMVESLVDYFWHTHQHYADAAATWAYYPGCGSIYGARNDAIEGVSRLLPLWAAYASAPGLDATKQAAMLAALHRSMVHGTQRSHPGYWGDIGARSTLICEAADIALALWLAREALVPMFTAQEFDRVMAWLRQVVGQPTADNNWHLFIALVDAVLAALAPGHVFSSQERVARVETFLRSDGCFVDGPRGRVDHYNAWAFHYALFWLREIDPALPGERMYQALGDFCTWYQLLFTPRGLPLFGRSLCYRFATPVPLLACAQRDGQVVPPGVAISALQSVWRFFVEEGGLAVGRPTQGVFSDDVRWLDPYSGPASSLWSTRSLTMYLYTARTIDWATVVPLPLPASRHETNMRVEGLGARIATDPRRGSSDIVFDETWPMWGDRTAHSLKDRVRNLVLAVPQRPDFVPAGDGRHFSSELGIYRP